MRAPDFDFQAANLTNNGARIQNPNQFLEQRQVGFNCTPIAMFGQEGEVQDNQAIFNGCPSSNTQAMRRKKMSVSRQLNDFLPTNFSSTKINPNGLDSALLQIQMEKVFYLRQAFSDCNDYFDDLMDKGAKQA